MWLAIVCLLPEIIVHRQPQRLRGWNVAGSPGVFRGRPGDPEVHFERITHP